MLDPALAALIGAGAASVASLGTQWLAHALATKRERRKDRLDRLYRVVAEAAAVLYGWHPNDISSNGKQRGRALMRVRLIGKRYPALHDPQLQWLWNNLPRASASLEIHFGAEHFLVREYHRVGLLCCDAELAQARHRALAVRKKRHAWDEEERTSLKAAYEARAAWMILARKELDAI